MKWRFCIMTKRICRMNFRFHFSIELKERFYSFHLYICKEMKTFLLRIFCLLMAFQVLFASTGFAMYEHFCKIKGAKTYSLSAPNKTCCSVKNGNKSEEKQSALKRAKCCSDQITYHKISPNASQGHKIDFTTPSLAWVFTPVFTYAYIHTSENLSYNTLHYSNSAPPLSGRDRLVFIQSFLI
jgi:hypothetical protein